VRGIRRLPDEERRVTSAELFFDLVFVFVVTQLSALLVADLTLSGAAKTAFLLLAAWWAWVYTAWATNWFDASTLVVRVILLVSMIAGLLGAISIPEAFGDRAPLLVAGYVGIQSVRSAFIVLATHRDDPLFRPVQRVLGWTLAVSPLWIAGVLLRGDARMAVWGVALALDYAGPFAGHWMPGLGRSRPSEWHLEPSHFVERLELFLIIALGESIVAAGATTSGLEPTAGRLTAMLVCTLMTAAFWWLYFDVHAGRTLEQLRAAADERGRLGRDISYLYVVLVAGIIVAAVGNELVIAHPGRRLHGAELVALAAGPVLYLLGSVALKIRVLRLRWDRRFATAVLLAAGIALGGRLPSLALWTAVLVVLALLAVVEAIEARSGAEAVIDEDPASETAVLQARDEPAPSAASARRATSS
jgi:low temperature requirement protein LtrA